MATSLSSNFWGDVIEELMVLAVTGNEIVDGGHIHVEDNIQKRRAIPRLKMDSIIQDMAATPTSQGTFTIDERQLDPDPFLVYVEWDPNDFRALWEPFAPTGDFVFTELNPTVQSAILREVLEGSNGVNEFMGKAILQGDKVTPATAPLNKFNGLIYRAKNDADVIDVTNYAALTSSNIIEKLQDTYEATRIPVRMNSNFKILTSVVDFEKYREALVNLTNKSIDPTQDAPNMFHGRKLVPLVGMPENVMIATIADSSRGSNIYLGVQGLADYSSIKVAPVQNNSDLWFLKMKMAADTQIKFGQDLTLYSA